MNTVSFYIVSLGIKLGKYRKRTGRKDHITSFQEIAVVFKKLILIGFFHLVYAYIFKTQQSLGVNGMEILGPHLGPQMWGAVDPCHSFICTEPPSYNILDHF